MMLKALLKKQLLEFFSGMFTKENNGNEKSKISKTGALILVFIVIVSFFFMFFSMAFMMSPIISSGYTWIYFAIFGILSVLLGVFGSVFLTYNTVYEAKDNDMLLSMPIPPQMILFSRMFGLYLTALCFEALVFVPACTVYFITAPFSFVTLVFCPVSLFVLPFFSLALSSVLGWIIALFASKIRNKSVITVAFSVGFFAVYYFVAMRLNTIINMIIYNAEEIGEKIKTFLYPFYQFGKGIEGDAVSYLAFFFITAVLFSAVYKVLSHTFLKLATSQKGMKKAVYKEKKAKQGSVKVALFKKELVFFKNTPVYILNCGLGSLMLILFAVFAAVKKEDLSLLLGAAGLPEQSVSVLVGIVTCFIASTNNLTSSSISLEGKNLWILKTAPVYAGDVFFGKTALHMTVTGIPLIIANIIIHMSIKTDIVTAVAVTVFTLLFTLVCAESGLVGNLLFPKMEWINESVPIKQSVSSFIGMFFGLLLTLFFTAVCIITVNFISPIVFLLSGSAFLVIVSALLQLWLKKYGIKKFVSL